MSRFLLRPKIFRFSALKERLKTVRPVKKKTDTLSKWNKYEYFFDEN